MVRGVLVLIFKILGRSGEFKHRSSLLLGETEAAIGILADSSKMMGSSNIEPHSSRSHLAAQDAVLIGEEHIDSDASVEAREDVSSQSIMVCVYTNV